LFFALVPPFPCTAVLHLGRKFSLSKVSLHIEVNKSSSLQWSPVPAAVALLSVDHGVTKIFVGSFVSTHTLLSPGYCLLSAVCCLLSAVCCLLSAVCCLLSAVCCLLSAILLLDVCCL
jgi:hypothetical protein